MTRPKGTNCEKVRAFCFAHFRKGGSAHEQKKETADLAGVICRQGRSRGGIEERILEHQISKLTRNARTHRLCTRAGMLESFLPNPELLTDDEVMTVLKIAFNQPGMKPVLEKLAMESEARETLTE